MGAEPAEKPNHAPSPAMREMLADDDRSIKEWMDSLAGDGAIRVQITRKKPSVGPAGESIAGILETVEDRVDDEYLKDVWGGGVFQLKVFRLNQQGNWVYLRARTISIAGPPKMAGVSLGAGSVGAAPISVAGGSDELVDRAMSALERSTRRAEERMERLEAERKAPGMDTAALDAVLSPMRDELHASRMEARELRQQLYDATTRPPPRDDFRDRLMERLVDGESQRVESIRAQYEARIDRLREAHDEDVKRLEARHDEALRRVERQHERTIEGVEKTLDERTAAMRLGYDMRIDTLKGQIAALERDLATSQARAAALEAQKNQSLPEKASELLQIREALEGLGGGVAAAAAGDGAKAWWEKAIDAVGNSEAVLALVNKVSGGEAPQPQLPPPGVPFRGPDGHAYVVGPDGQPRRIQTRAAAAAAAARTRRTVRSGGGAALPAPASSAPRAAMRGIDSGLATAAQAPAQPAGDDEAAGATAELEVAAAESDGVGELPQGVRAPDAREVKIAVTFMENAVRNGTSAEQFSSSFRTLVPQDVLRFIQVVGIDAFLDRVVEPGSSLATQRGRNFARAVAKLMVGHAT